MANIKDIQKNLTDQLKATNGVVSATKTFIGTTEQSIDTALTEMRNQYLLPFDTFEQSMENISKAIKTKLDNIDPSIDVEVNIDSKELINKSLPESIPSFIKTKVAALLQPIINDLISQTVSGSPTSSEFIISQITSIYDLTLKPIKDQIDNVLNTVKDTIGALLKTVSDIVEALSKILTQDGPNIVNQLGEQVVGAKAASLPPPPGIVGEATGKLKGIMPNLSFLQTIQSTLTSGISTLISGITSILSTLGNTLSSITSEDSE